MVTQIRRAGCTVLPDPRRACPLSLSAARCLTNSGKRPGGKLADRWASTSVPAIIFWLGGLLCWISSHGGASDLRKLAGWAARQSAPVQLVILITALLGVAASGVIVQRLAVVGLRLIEGYWPPLAGLLSRWRTGRIAAKAENLEGKFQDLAGPVLESKSATAAQRAEFTEIEHRQQPLAPRHRPALPSRAGPRDRHQLDRSHLADRTRRDLRTGLAAFRRRDLAAA